MGQPGNAPSIQSKYLRVKPGQPGESYLISKLSGTHLNAGGSGARMPLGGAPLDAATLAKIKLWIDAGAKND